MFKFYGVTGTYSADVNLQNKSETIKSNTTTTIQADNNYDGLGTVTITTDVIPNLQSKTEYILSNGNTVVIEPDNGYDGLEKVQVVTQIDPVWQFIGYETTPQTILDDFAYSEDIMINYIETIHPATNLDNLYVNNTNLKHMPFIPTMDVTSMRGMFRQCSNLENIPVLPTDSLIQIDGIFDQCPKLSEEALYNIIEMCINATNVQNKYFNMLGLSGEQVNKCRNLKNFNRLIEAGWTVF